MPNDLDLDLAADTAHRPAPCSSSGLTLSASIRKARWTGSPEEGARVAYRSPEERAHASEWLLFPLLAACSRAIGGAPVSPRVSHLVRSAVNRHLLGGRVDPSELPFGARQAWPLALRLLESHEEALG